MWKEQSEVHIVHCGMPKRTKYPILTLLCPMCDPICTDRTFPYQILQKEPNLSQMLSQNAN